MKKLITIIVLVLLLNVIVIPAIGANCQWCQGYSGWHGGDPNAGTPPDCAWYSSSRLLGTCVNGTTGSCEEKSKATIHTKIYTPYVPLERELVCAALYASDLALCWDEENPSDCQLQALLALSECLDDMSECRLDSDDYHTYMIGCSG